MQQKQSQVVVVSEFAGVSERDIEILKVVCEENMFGFIIDPLLHLRNERRTINLFHD